VDRSAPETKRNFRLHSCDRLAELFFEDAGISPTHIRVEALSEEIQKVATAFIDNDEPTESEQGFIPIPAAYAEQ
jgi:hypothetical protein